MTELSFAKAEFGGPTGCWTAPLAVAQPPEGCGAYQNLAEVRDAIVFVRRGLCTFHDKALQAQEQGARAIVVVNEDNDVIAMPGPEAGDGA